MWKTEMDIMYYPETYPKKTKVKKINSRKLI